MSIQTRRRKNQARTYAAVLSASVEPETKALIERIANLENVPVSVIVREALNKGLPKVQARIDARDARRAAQARRSEKTEAEEAARTVLAQAAPDEWQAYETAWTAYETADADADAALEASAEASDAAADAAMDKADAALAKAKARAEASINALKQAAPAEWEAYETARTEADK